MCDTYFSRLVGVENHMRKIHPPNKQALMFSCGICEEGFCTQKELVEHRQSAHVKTNDFTLMGSAFRRQAMHLRAFFADTPITLDMALAHCRKTIPPVLETSLVYNKVFKCSIIVFLEMYKVNAAAEVSRIDMFVFRAAAFIVRPFNNFKKDVVKALKSIDKQVDDFIFQVSLVLLVTYFLFLRVFTPYIF
jgi:hypothetical protein